MPVSVNADQFYSAITLGLMFKFIQKSGSAKKQNRFKVLNLSVQYTSAFMLFPLFKSEMTALSSLIRARLITRIISLNITKKDTPQASAKMVK